MNLTVGAEIVQSLQRLTRQCYMPGNKTEGHVLGKTKVKDFFLVAIATRALPELSSLNSFSRAACMKTAQPIFLFFY